MVPRTTVIAKQNGIPFRDRAVKHLADIEHPIRSPADDLDQSDQTDRYFEAHRSLINSLMRDLYA